MPFGNHMPKHSFYVDGSAQFDDHECNKIANTVINQLQGKNDPILKQLRSYLITRKSERNEEIQTPDGLFFNSDSQLKRRSLFIKKLVEADVDEKIRLLSEKNIKQFKGLFTQRLYDILTNYRNNLESQYAHLNPSL